VALEKEGWHLDKRVPIGLILTIIIQTVYMTWWASKIDSRVSVLESNSSSQELDVTSLSSQLTALNISLARLEVRQESLQSDVREVLERD
jgi:uncharacterized coiled-coil protein SlyX